MIGFFSRLVRSFSRPQDVGQTPRGSGWKKARDAHIKTHPNCAACGRTKNQEVHHVKSFSEHPELELDPENMRTLCADPCHIVWGHLMNFSLINPDIDEHCSMYREAIKRAK